MKYWIIALICLFFVVGCAHSTYTNYRAFPDGTLTGEPFPSGTYLEKDRWDSDRINIKSQHGATEGYIKPDRWEPDRLNIYDQLGRPTGTYLKKDRWQPDRWNIKGNTK